MLKENAKQYEFIKDFDEAKKLLKKIISAASVSSSSSFDQNSFDISNFTNIYSALTPAGNFFGLKNDYEVVILGHIGQTLRKHYSQIAEDAYRETQMEKYGDEYITGLQNFETEKLNEQMDSFRERYGKLGNEEETE